MIVLEKQPLPILIIFVLAALLHHVVSWAGSILHGSAVAGQSDYAVFTFRDDIDLPMSKNVFMNIFIPNIALIILYIIASNMGYEKIQENLWLFVLFYYIYRALLICMILRRKELYKVQYELFMMIFALITEYFTWNFFISSEENIFIEISELRNEIWLVILVIVYKFAEMLIDRFAHQKNVVSEKMLKRYIAKKFKEFYKKYNDCLQINYENRIICILLYAIMIFENFNRGRIIRFFENIKVSLGKPATVGIMQVKSNKRLTDEESIGIAYDMLEKDIIKRDKQIDDDEQIWWYAWEYNHGDNYAKSIVFIYRHLKEYLQSSSEFRSVFYLQELEEDAVQEEQGVGLDEEQGGQDVQVEWLTLNDVELMTGLSKKEILKIQRKKNAVILFRTEEVRENFEEYLRE